MPTLTQAHLHEILNYNSETGVFTWLVNPTRGAHRAGSIAGWMDSGYVKIKIGGRTYKAHRLAWFYVYGEWPGRGLDHKSGIPNHNQIDNLRLATQTQNMQNAKKRNNKSGVKGVSWNKHVKFWAARITVNGQRKFLGYFDDPKMAHVAYITYANQVFGEFARAA